MQPQLPMLTLTTTAPLPHLKCEMEGTNFFHFIFYFIIYMLTCRHLSLQGALSTLEYMYMPSLDWLYNGLDKPSVGLVTTGPATGKQLRWTSLCWSSSWLCRYVE
jgi:hypothetical protein